MAAGESLVHGVLCKLGAWFPGMAAAAAGSGGSDAGPSMSREFWMPDQSCRACYECESQFTIFNRRHHCRICGKIFCGKCTLTTVPGGVVPEEGERVRVCKFCYKYKQQEVGSGSNSEASAGGSPSLTPTSSRSSLFSSNASGTSMASPSSTSQSTKPFSVDGSNLYYDSKQNFKDDVNARPEATSSSYLCRSDDEEEKEGQASTRSEDDDGDVETRHRRLSSQISETSQQWASDRLSTSASRRSCDDIEGLEYEANFHGQLYQAAYSEVPVVDFENNKLVWIPPLPEDDEDEAGPGYEDEDEDEEGAWGLPRSSGSLSSSDFRNREKAASEEHRKAMRSVVDGHFRALVAQLLKGEGIPVEDEDVKDSWLEIVTSLALQAASIVKPDSSRGGSMDPGGYVKVKCIASGRRSDSTMIKGIVCKKNLAHKRMAARFKNPRLLLLGGALEYQRVSNHFSSVDVLLQQERDYLNMAAARIEAHHPNVVLVEQGVSRFAQDRLLAKEISLVLKVKRPLLERIAKCTGAQVVPSPDHLTNPTFGHCELFHVEKYLEEHGSAGQGGKPLTKTLMFFEGCPKPLGCTVLLRGANGDELKKIKRVIQLAVFAAYHLALETSFLADEGATLPDLKSPIVVTLPNKQSVTDRSISSVPGFSIPAPQVPGASQFTSGADAGTSVPGTLSGTSAQDRSGSLVSATQPAAALASRTMDTGPRLGNGQASGAARELQIAFSQSGLSGLSALSRACYEDSGFFMSGTLMERLARPAAAASEDLFAHHLGADEDVSGDASFHEHQVENDLDDDSSAKDDFPPTPSDHQSILVSFSARCRTKGTVCERPNILRIKYYGNSDKPLGRFLRDTLFDVNNRCPRCEEPPDAHISCYTHRLGSLTISVRRLEEDRVLPGAKEGKIWMWHRCLKCPRSDGIPPVTRRIVMSDAAWGLSFGKFLELSFSNHAAVSRVAACGHSLHRDCLRFYGFDNMIACFRYSAVHLHAVHLPPHKLEFHDPLQQEWLKMEAEEVASKGEAVFAEILDALRVIGEHIATSGSFSGSGKIADIRRRMVQLENLFQTEKSQFEEALAKAAPLRAEPGQPIADVLELNRLRLNLYLRALEWDKRLHYFASCQQRKLSTASDTAVLIEAAVKDKSQLLKTYSNSDVGGILQPFKDDILEIASSRLSSTDTAGGTDAESSSVPCSGDLLQEDATCLPTSTTAEQQQITELETRAGEIRRSLSEGLCPANLSLTLDAAWVGQGQAHAAAEVPGTAVNPEEESSSNSSSSRKETDACDSALDSESEADRLSSKPSFSSLLTPSNSRQSLQADGRNDDMDDIGNWIGGPYSTLYRGRTPSNISPKSLGEGPMSRAAQVALEGSARLFFPVGVNGVVVPVREDEPTSVIANALVYATDVSSDRDRKKDRENGDVGTLEESFPDSFDYNSSMKSTPFSSFSSSSSSLISANGMKEGKAADDPLLNSKEVNLKIENAEVGPEAKLKYTVVAYYAKHFEALRKRCCDGDLEYVRSLCRCRKWGAQGGKSNVFFAKTLDDRFIVKQLTRTELLSFLDFAPGYFKYLSEVLTSGSPTCLAKILGIYQVVIKQTKGGKEIRMDLMVMENLLYARRPTRMYDLKGSVRSRYNSDSTGKNAVLLDQNLLESMPTAPIFVGNKAKRQLERAVWNDTSFLALIDVMDYSLLVGIDEERGELVLGIIDFVRQYTWDKHLETWVKASGILGGPKNTAPTVISPIQYKKRFRKAMSTYFVTVPDHWTPPSVITAHLGGEGEDQHQHEQLQGN